MKTKQIILARHATTNSNENGKSRGWNMDPLDAKGKKQAGTLANEMKSKGIKHIISSDLPRAKQTAGIIAKKTGATVKTDPELRTWNIGKMTGKPTKDIEGSLNAYKAHPSEKIPGGESYNDFKKRAEKGLLKASGRHGQILVVHNEVGKLLGLKLQPGKATTGFLKK